MHDRVGIGWRPELAAGILSNLDRIDVLEVIAADYFESAARVRTLKTLIDGAAAHGRRIQPRHLIRLWTPGVPSKP